MFDSWLTLGVELKMNKVDWWKSWLMRKSNDDKVEKALQMNRQTNKQTDIANSRVASWLKKLIISKTLHTLIVLLANMVECLFKWFGSSQLWT